MLVTSIQEFQETVLKNITFEPYPQKNYTLYHNPNRKELGYYKKYIRNDYYEFGIADYTVPANFSLTFDNPALLMRFGILYEGKTKYRLENKPISSFTPSSFFVVENNLKGQQIWKEGWHFHGAEIILYEKYFTNILYPSFQDCVTHKNFLFNYTYNYLPITIISIIQQLNNLAQQDKLTPILLESKIMECIAILTDEMKETVENVFINQTQHGNVKVGDRTLTLNASDIHAIQKAHDIISKDFVNTPTISNLSKQILLNEQKLKAGFSYYYHMSIGEYTSSLRMALAANLLSTTDLTIEEIGKEVGYSYCGNFTKKFKKIYGTTPLQFRKYKK